jgi:iron complex transport system permease protein
MCRLVALACVTLAICCAALFFGSYSLSPADLAVLLNGTSDETARTVFFDIRLPRMLTALGVGALLAVSGVLLQALFRNPLVDPYVLGISGGAAVGALSAILLGSAWITIQSAAMCGAVVVMLVVYILARNSGTTGLLLTGVVLASACGALIALILAVAEGNPLRGMVFWLSGDLSWANTPLASLLAAILAVSISVIFARPLNVLAAGELRAASLGLELTRWRVTIFALCAALTALAVIHAGTIGFVGLIAPHFARLFLKTNDHRRVAPAAALLGGALVVGADLLARTLVSPRLLPVGAVMALLGTPLFIALLRRRGRLTEQTR